MTTIMKRCSLLALVTSALLIAQTESTISAQTVTIISGVVRDVKGNPIEGATITIENAGQSRSEEITTNSGGRFSFVGLPRGRWAFIVEKRGFAPMQRQANILRFGRSGLSFVMKFDPFHPPAPSIGVLAGLRADDIQNELNTAHDLFDNRNYDAAIDAYKTILNRIPHLTSLNLRIGHAFRAKEDYENALVAYRTIPANTPASNEAKSAIAELEVKEMTSDFEGYFLPNTTIERLEAPVR